MGRSGLAPEKRARCTEVLTLTNRIRSHHLQYAGLLQHFEIALSFLVCYCWRFLFIFLVHFAYPETKSDALESLFAQTLTCPSSKESRAYSELLISVTSQDNTLIPLLYQMILKRCSHIHPDSYSRTNTFLLSLFDYLCICLSEVVKQKSDDLRPRSLTDAAIKLSHIISNEPRHSVARKLFIRVYHIIVRTLSPV